MLCGKREVVTFDEGNKTVSKSVYFFQKGELSGVIVKCVWCFNYYYTFLRFSVFILLLFFLLKVNG